MTAMDHKFLWFRGMINQLGCWQNTRRIYKSLTMPVVRDILGILLSVVPTSSMVYQPTCGLLGRMFSNASRSLNALRVPKSLFQIERSFCNTFKWSILKHKCFFEHCDQITFLNNAMEGIIFSCSKIQISLHQVC